MKRVSDERRLKRIYLIQSEHCGEDGCDAHIDGSVWCQDRQCATDTEYVLAEDARAEIARLEARVRELDGATVPGATKIETRPVTARKESIGLLRVHHPDFVKGWCDFIAIREDA